MKANRQQMKLFGRNSLFGGNRLVRLEELVPEGANDRVIRPYYRLLATHRLIEDQRRTDPACYDRLRQPSVFRRLALPGDGVMPRVLYDHHVFELLERAHVGENLGIATMAQVLWMLGRQAAKTPLNDEAVELMKELVAAIYHSVGEGREHTGRETHRRVNLPVLFEAKALLQ